MDDLLTVRDLNRATLARQLLLERSPLSVDAALERLVALQAQLPSAPYVALWSRLAGFERAHLTDRLVDHSIVKATSMRATLHLLAANDHVRIRPTLEPLFEAALAAITKKRGVLVDRADLLAAARPFIDESARTFAEISAMLSARWPDHDVGAMRYTVRTQLPLVQVPRADGWGFPGNPTFALAETWLGGPIEAPPDPAALVRRYLAAFGPATVADIQSWTGLASLKDVVRSMGDELVTIKDDRKRTLFDLPDSPRPSADVPAPVRFLPEFDNVLSGHKDRLRFIADEHRPKVYLPALRVAPTILIDGFVAGVWKFESAKRSASLIVEPFGAITAETRRELLAEGEQLARFLDPAADACRVEVVDR